MDGMAAPWSINRSSDYLVLAEGLVVVAVVTTVDATGWDSATGMGGTDWGSTTGMGGTAKGPAAISDLKKHMILFYTPPLTRQTMLAFNLYILDVFSSQLSLVCWCAAYNILSLHFSSFLYNIDTLDRSTNKCIM